MVRQSRRGVGRRGLVHIMTEITIPYEKNVREVLPMH